MDRESIKTLDDISEFDDVIEVDFRVPVGKGMDEVRTIIGLYAGLERAGRGAWYLLIHDRATIRTIDLLSVRKIPTMEAV